jgi:putative membrane protein insertion efficiency factor
MKNIIIFVIKGYQRFLSPMLGARCRFHPSCSSYAIESIEKKGLIRGIFASAARLTKCHPLHSGGYDPVVIDSYKKFSDQLNLPTSARLSVVQVKPIHINVLDGKLR